jgi:hypothetical protein
VVSVTRHHLAREVGLRGRERRGEVGGLVGAAEPVV